MRMKRTGVISPQAAFSFSILYNWKGLGCRLLLWGNWICLKQLVILDIIPVFSLAMEVKFHCKEGFGVTDVSKEKMLCWFSHNSVRQSHTTGSCCGQTGHVTAASRQRRPCVQQSLPAGRKAVLCVLGPCGLIASVPTWATPLSSLLGHPPGGSSQEGDLCFCRVNYSQNWVWILFYL